jgi:hypothetical protein
VNRGSALAGVDYDAVALGQQKARRRRFGILSQILLLEALWTQEGV